jgi:hypothetical protein
MAYGNLLMSPIRLPSAHRLRQCELRGLATCLATCEFLCLEFWRARRIEHDLALLCVQGDPGA